MKRKSIYRLSTGGRVLYFERIEKLRRWLWHHRPAAANVWKETWANNRSFSIRTVYRRGVIVDGDLYAAEVNEIRGPKMSFEIQDLDEIISPDFHPFEDGDEARRSSLKISTQSEYETFLAELGDDW